MSEFTFLNFKRTSHHGVDELTKLCLCCLEKDVTFVNVSTCKHFGILEKLCSISVPKMELDRLVCCRRCHAKLKTINNFKLQAEETFTMLWNRQYSATKSTMLKEVLSTEAGVNVEYLPEELHTYRTLIKTEQNPVTDHPPVVSGCWLSDLHCQPNDEASSDQEMCAVPPTKVKEEHIEKEECINRICRPIISKISTMATNYHIKVGNNPDSPQDNAALSELDVPLAKIKGEVEIEITESQTCDQVGGDGSKLFADRKTILTEAAVDSDYHHTQCNQMFASKRTLINHDITMHHNYNPKEKPPSGQHKCDPYARIIKDITLTHEELLLEREKELQSETYLQRLYRCDLCIVSYNHEQSVKDHAKKHQLVENSFQCGICQCVYETDLILKAHEKKHYIRYECGWCQKRYSTLTSITDHCNSVHDLINQVMYSCSKCNYTTMTQRHYSNHVRKHKGRFLCIICNRTFTTKTSLKAHTVNIHGKSSGVQCKECDKRYKSQRYLDVHHKLKHMPPSFPDGTVNEATPSSYCDTCNIFFKNDKELQNHYKRHRNHISENDKRYVCDICNKRFLTKHEIKDHIIWLHLKLKEHICPQCNKSYVHKRTLKAHVKSVHLKVRPPKNKICDYCGQGFNTEQILRIHIRRHTGERPYQCAQCSATFTQNASFRTHVKLVHTKSHNKKD